MERQIKFTIVKAGTNTVRIVPHDIRDTFKKIADGGCICDLETMYGVMEQITEDCKKIGCEAVFWV
jgi:hypothetical protein